MDTSLHQLDQSIAKHKVQLGATHEALVTHRQNQPTVQQLMSAYHVLNMHNVMTPDGTIHSRWIIDIDEECFKTMLTSQGSLDTMLEKQQTQREELIVELEQCRSVMGDSQRRQQQLQLEVEELQQQVVSFKSTVDKLIHENQKLRSVDEEHHKVSSYLRLTEEHKRWYKSKLQSLQRIINVLKGKSKEKDVEQQLKNDDDVDREKELLEKENTLLKSALQVILKGVAQKVDIVGGGTGGTRSTQTATIEETAISSGS